MKQPVCPTSEALASLLAATLPADQETVVSRHIEHCTDCQQHLDSLSEDNALDSFSRFKQASTKRETVPAWLLTRLLGTPPVADEPLPFLKPAQHKGDLGILGHYQVRQLLGRGGMGVVLLAFDTLLNRNVALKVLWPPPGTSEARQRIVREAQAVARIRHENVVGIHAVHQDAGDPPYLAMEFVPGKTLRDHLKQGEIPFPQMVQWLMHLAKGLAAAHAVGLIHRDVKPSNILIDEATLQARLTDFGLARTTMIETDIASMSMLAGTPAYMSPEQFLHSGHIDQRTDIYGLGVTLYEALTGAPPFRGPLEGVVRQVVEVEPVAPRHLNLAVPIDLETICLKCLAKEPAQRYASTQLLHDDLERFLEGKPILARPLGWPGRMVRTFKRHPVQTALAALLLMTLIAGTAISLYQWYRAEQNLQLAHEKMDAARRTIDQFCLRVSEDRLLNEPGMQPLRRELLNIAVPELQKLSIDKPSDPLVYDKWIKTTYLLAKLRRDLEGPEVALPILHQVLPVLEERFHHSPEDQANRRLLIDVLMYEGICRENLHQYAQAETIWQEIEGLLKGHEEPADKLLQSRLYINMGKSAYDQQLVKKSSALAQRARDVAIELTRTNPEIAEAHHCLATSTGNWASALALERDYPRAEKVFRDAISAWKYILRDRPKDLPAQSEILRNLMNLSQLYLMSARFADAREALETGLPIIEKLVRSYSQSLALKKLHGQFLINAGMCSQMTGQQDVAEKYYHRAVDALTVYHDDDPDEVPLYYDLIRARLVQAYLWQDRCRLEQAVNSLKQILSMLRDYAKRVPVAALEMKQHGHTVHLTLAVIYHEQGKLDAARSEVAEVARTQPWSLAFQKMVEGILEEQATGQDLTDKLLSHYQTFLADCKQAEAAAPQTAGMYYLAAWCASRCLKLVSADKSLTTEKNKELNKEFKSAMLRWLQSAHRYGYFESPQRKAALLQNPAWKPLHETESWKKLSR